MTKLFPSLLALALFLPAAGFGGKFEKALASKRRDQKLQAAFEQFPLLEPVINKKGGPAFQTLDLDSPVNIAGVDFYGFRFTVSGRTNKEDLVWAFVQNNNCSWYILPETGKMDGFEEYFYQPRRVYKNARGLLPEKAKQIITQRLPGDSLEDGKTYLIWLAFSTPAPEQMSLEFTFADVPPAKAHKMTFLEQILGLRRK